MQLQHVQVSVGDDIATSNRPNRPAWEVLVISSLPSIPSPAQHVYTERGDSGCLCIRFNSFEIAATAIR